MPYRGPGSSTIDLLMMAFLKGIAFEALLLRMMRKEAHNYLRRYLSCSPLVESRRIVGLALLIANKVVETRHRHVATPQEASFRIRCAMCEMVSALIHVREVYSNHSSPVSRDTVAYTREVIISWCRRRGGVADPACCCIHGTTSEGAQDGSGPLHSSHSSVPVVGGPKRMPSQLDKYQLIDQQR